MNQRQILVTKRRLIVVDVLAKCQVMIKIHKVANVAFLATIADDKHFNFCMHMYSIKKTLFYYQINNIKGKNRILQRKLLLDWLFIIV